LVAVSLQIADGAVRSGTHPIMFEVEALGTKERITQKSIFYMSR